MPPAQMLISKKFLPIFMHRKIKHMKMQLSLAAIFIFSLCACNNSKPEEKHDPLAKASRENKNGWVYVHLEGSPTDIGYQHGYLLAEEIDTTLRMFQYIIP